MQLEKIRNELLDIPQIRKKIDDYRRNKGRYKWNSKTTLRILSLNSGDIFYGLFGQFEYAGYSYAMIKLMNEEDYKYLDKYVLFKYSYKRYVVPIVESKVVACYETEMIHLNLITR